MIFIAILLMVQVFVFGILTCSDSGRADPGRSFSWALLAIASGVWAGIAFYLYGVGHWPIPGSEIFHP
jgi:hypothetical protein